MIGSILVGIGTENGAENLLLSWRKGAVGTVGLARWEMLGMLTGRVCVLVIVSLALRR